MAKISSVEISTVFNISFPQIGQTDTSPNPHKNPGHLGGD